MPTVAKEIINQKLVLSKQEELIVTVLKESPGLKRVIKHLWANCYRVNYQDKISPHYIIHSYFVTIQDGKVIVNLEKVVKI